METTVFTCKNCGFPLNVPDGAESITCPQCRGINALPSKVDANAKIQLTLLELQTAKDEYHKVFLPKKEKAEEKVEAELANFNRLYREDNTGSGVRWSLIFVAVWRIFAWIIFFAGSIHLVVSFYSETNFNTLLAFVVWLLWLWYILVEPVVKKRRENSKRTSKRAEIQMELMQTRDKWTREEEERKAKIAELEGVLRKFRGA